MEELIDVLDENGNKTGEVLTKKTNTWKRFMPQNNCGCNYWQKWTYINAKKSKKQGCKCR